MMILRNVLIIMVSVTGFILVVACGAQGAHLNALCEIKDLDETMPIVAKAVSLVTAGNIEPFENRKGMEGWYHYVGIIDGNYKIMIEPTREYDEREIELILNPAKKNQNINKTVKQFFVKKDVQATRQFLSKGTNYLKTRQYEKAFAVYNHAFKNIGGDINWHSVMVKYNYARCLLELCKSQDYNTSKQSYNLFSELLDLYPDYKKVFDSLKIKEYMLKDGMRNSQLAIPIKVFSQIPILYKNQEYIASAKLAEKALVQWKRNPEDFNRIGLTEERLLKDAATSFLKEFEKRERNGVTTENDWELLDKSREYYERLKQIGKLSGASKTNYEVINQKYKIKTYSRIPELYKNKEYKAAAELAEKALSERPGNEAVFDSIGLTEERLFDDAATSYMKEYEKREQQGDFDADDRALLGKSLQYFKKLDDDGKLSGASLINYEIVNQKLNAGGS